MISKSNESAVSPVVGVMLLLIVTIIIAAVVSGFSGGLIDSTGKAPELTMDVHIRNNGYWSGSEFSARVTGVDKAIPTSDLKIVTSWNHKDSDGRLSGGATIMPNEPNTHLVWSPSNSVNYLNEYFWVAPYGYGIGVGDKEGSAGTGSGQGKSMDKHYGNYSLTVGTVMWAEPFGADTRPSAGAYSGVAQDKVGYGITDTSISNDTLNGGRWEYLYNNATGTSGGFKTSIAKGYIRESPVDLVFNPPDENGVDGRMQEFIDEDYHDTASYDAMTAVLGKDWEQLRAGDIVTMSVVHIPTGKTIWEDDVVVEA